MKAFNASLFASDEKFGFVQFKNVNFTFLSCLCKKTFKKILWTKSLPQRLQFFSHKSVDFNALMLTFEIREKLIYFKSAVFFLPFTPKCSRLKWANFSLEMKMFSSPAVIYLTSTYHITANFLNFVSGSFFLIAFFCFIFAKVLRKNAREMWNISTLWHWHVFYSKEFFNNI